MSKFEKLKVKFLSLESSINFQELGYLLGKFGYKEKKTGKTSDSRIAFIDLKSKHIIRIHKPHPGNELKKYVQLYIIEELRKKNLL